MIHITQALGFLLRARFVFDGVVVKRLPIYPISTGKLEGFNNKIKVAKRIGYGYRDDDVFFTLIRYLSISSVPSPSHNNP